MLHLVQNNVDPMGMVTLYVTVFTNVPLSGWALLRQRIKLRPQVPRRVSHFTHCSPYTGHVRRVREQTAMAYINRKGIVSSAVLMKLMENLWYLASE